MCLIVYLFGCVQCIYSQMSVCLDVFYLIGVGDLKKTICFALINLVQPLCVSLNFCVVYVSLCTASMSYYFYFLSFNLLFPIFVPFFVAAYLSLLCRSQLTVASIVGTHIFNTHFFTPTQS